MVDPVVVKLTAELFEEARVALELEAALPRWRWFKRWRLRERALVKERAATLFWIDNR